MRACTTILLTLAAAASAIAADDALKTLPGCVAVDDAKPGPQGYAYRVIHEKTGIELILIPAGAFRMGTDDRNASSSPKPAHDVTITRPF